MHATLLRGQARHVRHMQKALKQMNVQLANVIADVVGETGQRILRAIVAGERDGQVLGQMKHHRSHLSVEERASTASKSLKLAAAALRPSQSALGACFRRLCARMDKPKAITAAAHKPARLICTMLTTGEAYVDQGQAYYEELYRERVLHPLEQRAQQLGMTLVAHEQPA